MSFFTLPWASVHSSMWRGVRWQSLRQSRGDPAAAPAVGGGCRQTPGALALRCLHCRLERLIVKDFATQPAGSHKDKLLQSHRVRSMLDSIQERSRKLVSRGPRCMAAPLCCPPSGQCSTAVHISNRLLPYPPALPQIRIYDDEDGARKEEIAQLRLGGADNVFRCGSVGAAGLPAQQALACVQRVQACPCR